MIEPSEAHREGAQCRTTKLPISANPYPDGSKEFEDWELGWQLQDEISDAAEGEFDILDLQDDWGDELDDDPECE